MKARIYLDNNATTFTDPRVSLAVYQHLEKSIGNPSSVHSYGREARAILQNARRHIAGHLAIKPQETIFTSGGTEGLNTVIRGLLDTSVKGHVISSAVEHSAVYATLKQMQAAGWKVSFLEPGLWGAVTPDAILKALRPDTRLIALMAANNETGVKTDIPGIAMVAQEAKIPFVVDGVALLGKEAFAIPAGVSAMCFSGHKIHAPAGVGFCFIRSTLKMPPLLAGGEQEFQRRGGSENLSGIVGLAEAMRLLQEALPVAIMDMEQRRDRLEKGILERVPGATVNGEGPRISNTTNIAFNGLEGESLLAALDMEGIAVSHGSACSSGALEPSRVLLGMGLSRQVARSSLRISLSRFTTDAEVDSAIDAIATIASRLHR